MDFCHPGSQKSRIRFPISIFTSVVHGNAPQAPNSSLTPTQAASDVDLHNLQDLIHRDPFYELSEQDKALLWRTRDTCCRTLFPAESLPWLVQAVSWERLELVEEFYRLLASWPRPLPVETCLQLLGVAGLAGSVTAIESSFGVSEGVAGGSGGGYVMAGGRTTGVADPLVRDIAVQGLQAGLSNMELADYLLQLVQSMNVDLYLFEKSPLGDREKPESARSRALLLDTTFKALSGDAEEAKSRFLTIGETCFAHPSIRVNALIKAAALFMTLDNVRFISLSTCFLSVGGFLSFVFFIPQDISGCMYTFQEAQTLDPLCADVYLHRGQTNLLTGNLDAAEKDFSEAIRLKPDCCVAHAQRLYMHYRKAFSEGRNSECDKVVNDFKLLRKKYPTCIETISIFAQVLTERGEFESADELFAKLIELTPTSGMPYAQRGILILRSKQDAEAAEGFIEKGLEVDPRCEMAWELRGQLAMERGQHEKALESFQRALDESTIVSDRQHLFALREGLKAQLEVAKKYNLNLMGLYSTMREDIQASMLHAMSEGYGSL
ncbi:unnamed protein product [Rodentolepis nana]|uniref:PIK helical domain-containing protein n=1 Tax=Rodentolepis nana TaxID=102285 RepID=A0A3P7T2P5_RODNA|nr:unnamed protein product [Rodentolepis nana]